MINMSNDMSTIEGACEPRNMGYMERLGLWGTNSPFATFGDFLEVVGSRGVGALEMIAMDMKAQGMYVCRTLSFAGSSDSYFLSISAYDSNNLSC